LNHPKETEMKTSKILSAVALAILAATGAAHAETYDGVHALSYGRDRADVAVEAAGAARSGNVYSDVASSGVTQLSGSRERAVVREEAVATAHAPNQNLDRKAFYNSVIPSQYNFERASTRQAGL
jgi:hypothetical protein